MSISCGCMDMWLVFLTLILPNWLSHLLVASLPGHNSSDGDTHNQLRDLQRQNENVQRELEVKEAKLVTCMGSIKNFWSPELKKERALRKDESSKHSTVVEQMRVIQEDNQVQMITRKTKHLKLMVQALQEELRTQQDVNQLFGDNDESNHAAPGSNIVKAEGSSSSSDHERLRLQNEQQNRELLLLRRTLEEMNQRVESQKAMLSTRDESIRRLLEKVQSRGGTSGRMEEGVRLSHTDARVSQLEALLENQDKENTRLKEELQKRVDQSLGEAPSTRTRALQSSVELKDTRIASLERSVRELEDEIQVLRTNGPLAVDERDGKGRASELQRSHARITKNKVEQMRKDLSQKDSELLTLQTKLETLSNQNSDCRQHIDVLKESLSAKEQRASILQTEVEVLRQRLEEKEALLTRKSKQVQEVGEEKSALTGEINDLKDMLDVKERKIGILQKKVENLQQQIKDKEKQVEGLKDRLKALKTDSSNTDTALATLEEALSEKELIIERLRDQREREEHVAQDELENCRRENKELKVRLEVLQTELMEKESSLMDLKEHASSLASEALKKDARLKELEFSVAQKVEEHGRLETRLMKAQEAEDRARGSERIQQLEAEVAQRIQETSQAHFEVDRLLEILKEVESEKNGKDKHIMELESISPRQLKDQERLMSNLSMQEDLERGRDNIPTLDEQAWRDDNILEKSLILQELLRQKEHTIAELQAALHDTQEVVAERERQVAREGSARSALQQQLRETAVALERARRELDVTKARLSSSRHSLAEKETTLGSLRSERRHHIQDLLEMKQEALLAAISEKDANIALLEISAPRRRKSQEEIAALRREKERLVQQLKQQAQNRLKFMANSYDDEQQQHHRHPHYHRHHTVPRVQHGNQRPSPEQDEEEGIWA
uniref:ERC protein 2-like n=1 Tax=Myxine glutinosa TaxID=7769 RepID=UPI00358F034B